MRTAYMLLSVFMIAVSACAREPLFVVVFGFYFVAGINMIRKGY